MSQQAAVDGARVFAGLDHKLIEARSAGKQYLAVPAELRRRVRCFREILFGQLFQPDLAVDRHKNIDHERDQRLIRADIRRGFLAADMLLASSQREHESALALPVDRLADQAARHLPDKFFARGNHAAVGTAESQRDAKRLCFYRNDVGFARRLNDS